MDCDFIRKNLVEIAEQGLPRELEKEVDDHLKSCKSCSALVEQFAHTWQGWGQIERIEPSPAFWFRLEQGIREPQGKRARAGAVPWLPGWAGWLRPAAAVAILVLGILAGNYLGDFIAWRGLSSTGQQHASTQGEQLFDYYLGGLDDFPAGSFGEFYVNPSNDT